MPNPNDLIDSINSTDVNNAASKEDKKCAPGKTFEDGSCISLNVLIEMAKAHNKECEASNDSKNIIKLYPSFETLNRKKYKKYLVMEFKKKYNDVCTTGPVQKCWLSQPFIKRMQKLQQEELTKQTFRPDGPQGKFEWLNTLNINDVMKQYENKYKDFKFLGAVPMDFDDITPLGIKELDLTLLQQNGKHRIGIIFNLDESWKSGSHWVAGYADLNKGDILYFDSYGTEPEARVRKFMRRVAKYCESELKIKSNADHNKVRHQYDGSECGVYSINFILRMLRGDSFEEICKSKTPDRVVNKCRKVYFK